VTRSLSSGASENKVCSDTHKGLRLNGGAGLGFGTKNAEDKVHRYGNE